MNKILLYIIICSVSLYAKEGTLTGNLRLDLLRSMQDSLSATEHSKTNTSMDEKMNPFTNGLYSFVLPGAGQYEMGSYTRAAIYFTVEIVAIATAIVYNKKGDDQTSTFQNYADAHWSAVRYAKWINTYGVSDYGPSIAFSQADFDAIAQYDFSKINSWEGGGYGSHSEGFTHNLPKHGEQQYFELIGKYNQYKFGWDTYPLDAQGVPVSDNRDYDGMIPQQMKDYAVERGKANTYYTVAKTAVSLVVLNHVVSALDALLSARHHNRIIESNVGMSMQQLGKTNTVATTLDLKIHF